MFFVVQLVPPTYNALIITQSILDWESQKQKGGKVRKEPNSITISKDI